MIKFQDNMGFKDYDLIYLYDDDDEDDDNDDCCCYYCWDITNDTQSTKTFIKWIWLSKLGIL